MKMVTTAFLISSLLLLHFSVSFAAERQDGDDVGIDYPPVDWEEGTYAGDNLISHTAPLAAFGQHFTLDQQYYISDSTFSTNNDNRIDLIDLGYYVGHGSWHTVETSLGSDTLDLEHAGSSTTHRGWGTQDLDYMVLHSCQVIASHHEQANWHVPWAYDDSDDIFDGLHYLLGYRTNAWIANAPDVADCFGEGVSDGDAVTSTWMDCVAAFGYSEERANIIIPSDWAQGEDYDLLAYWGNPSATSINVVSWHQH